MATMLRDSVASAFYFSSYEVLKQSLTREGESGPGVLGTLFAGVYVRNIGLKGECESYQCM